MRSHSIPAIWIAVVAIFCVLVLEPSVAAQEANHPIAFSGRYRVAGVVVSKIDGHPLAQTRVALAETNNLERYQVVITSEDGRFVFPTVPAGKFSLSGRKRGFVTAGYDQHDQFSTAIVTGAGLNTESLVLKLAPNGMIHGKILDESGEPVRHARVTLYIDDHSTGVDQIHEARSEASDDLGAYEMTSLTPGTYYLLAMASPWYAVHPPSQAEQAGADAKVAPAANRSLDVAYPVTYYPDVTDSDSATPIPVRGGEKLEVDIHLNPVPALRLLFHVPGDQQHGYMFPQIQQHSFETSSFINAGNVAMVSPGVMEVTGIPAGRYDVQLQGAGTTLQMSGVDLSNEAQEVETSNAEAFSTVKMMVQAPDVGKNMELVAGLRATRKSAMRASLVNANGQADLQQVPAGRYEVVLFGRRRRYSISRVSAEGAEVSGHHVTIAAGSAASVSVTAVAGSVVVEGIAKRAGKPVAGAMVVLVPKNVEGDGDLFRRDQSDLDGTFRLVDVAPGSYTLVAIENGWDLDWSQPGVIAVYAKHGRPIEVTDTPGKALRVPSAIEVVSK
jgi:hypothetical protein